ncbi:MAG: Tim44-like domain-containing protein [Pseudomonadota bacterium]|nr:Tim44-like domain-containing protein [Pseudomonadota bacterium]
MSKWLLSILILILGGALVATEVDARRLGGGRAIGTQRSVTAPPAKPAQQQAAPANQAPQQAAPQGSRWGGILGGLALGGLLGYLFAGNGMGGFLMLALLAIAAVLVVRALARRRTQEAPRPVQFAGMGQQAVVIPPSPATGVAPTLAPARGSLPAGFDATGFLKGAKLNFVKLQMANDTGQLEEIREFTTTELFEELKNDVLARTAQGQQTDVMNLDADLLEVTTEQDRHWASVRFSGMVRESPAAQPEAFEEVWNLVKPADGSSGWLLAGIQQMH